MRTKDTTRYHDMDFVRASAMLLGLVLHVCIFFLPPRELSWWSGEYRGDEVNLQFWNLIHLFRMQLFFLMAGFFAELVIDRKGLPHLVRDRAKRILLPFLVGVLFLMPVVMVLGLGGMGAWYWEGSERTFLEEFQPYFLWGAFEPGDWIWEGLAHFWFLYYLLIFYAIHFCLRPAFESIGLGRRLGIGRFVDFTIRHRWGVVLLGVLCLPLQYLLPGMIFFPSGWNAPILDLVFYLVFYLFGAEIYHRRDRIEDLARHAWFYVALSIPFAFYIHDATSRIDDSAPVITDLVNWTILDAASGTLHAPDVPAEGIAHNGWYKVVVAGIRTTLCWTMCFAFIGLARRYLNRSIPVVRYIADSAYWVYWIHLPITFALSRIATEFSWPSSLMRSYLVLLASAILIYGSYNAFVRYGWLGDFFMGSRRSRDDPHESEFRLTALLRRAAPTGLAIGGVCLVLGFLLQYEREFQESDVLIESVVTRDVSIIERMDRIDGIADDFGNTPLHVAVQGIFFARNYEPIPLLLERTDDVDPVNEHGRTPLWYAVRNGLAGDVAALLEAGADPDRADRHGHAPTHVAAIKTGLRNPKQAAAFADILELLVEAGGDPDLRDERGRTVLECREIFGDGRAETVAASD